MGYKLIYIDDDIGNATIFRDGLITNDLLRIDVIKATDFEQQLKEIINIQNEFDGIILDLKLDENQEGKRKAFYTAPALAQQLRSKSVSNPSEFKHSFPIFLLTSREQLSKNYRSDVESHDLFERVFIKAGAFGTNAKEHEREIHSIISAYKKIEESSNYEEILDLEIDKDLKNRVFEKTFKESAVSRLRQKSKNNKS